MKHLLLLFLILISNNLEAMVMNLSESGPSTVIIHQINHNNQQQSPTNSSSNDSPIFFETSKFKMTEYRKSPQYNDLEIFNFEDPENMTSRPQLQRKTSSLVQSQKHKQLNNLSDILYDRGDEVFSLYHGLIPSHSTDNQRNSKYFNMDKRPHRATHRRSSIDEYYPPNSSNIGQSHYSVPQGRFIHF